MHGLACFWCHLLQRPLHSSCQDRGPSALRVLATLRGLRLCCRYGHAHKRTLSSLAGDGSEDHNGPGDPGLPDRKRSHRSKAAFSVLQGIRRHYATLVDLVSYVGLGLVLYAGDTFGHLLPALFATPCW